MTTDVLAFIEDPGAANFILPIVDALESRGLTVSLRTEGAAATYVARPSIGRDETAEALIARLKPRGVLVGTSENSETFGLALIDAAKRTNVPVAGVVDALGNASGRFRGRGDSSLHHAPDLILVADAATAGAFIALGHPSDRIAICGHPQHDAARERTRLLEAEGKDAVRRRVFGRAGHTGQPIIVFASEVSTGIGAEVFKRDAGYTLAGSGAFELRTEIVIEEFLEGVRRLVPKPTLVLRMHPKNTRAELAPFLPAFDDVSAGGPGLDVAFAADAVVGMSSILLVEAMLIGRPVLSILPREAETNLLSELRAGLIPVATTRAAVWQKLEILLTSGAPSGSVPATAGNASVCAAEAFIALFG